jgi:hypothetical protein
MKRPMEEEEGAEDKSPNKKKKKLQKKSRSSRAGLETLGHLRGFESIVW